jgi:ribose/xylose/arabinose/galactoside ABC-type transport system permease subunit
MTGVLNIARGFGAGFSLAAPSFFGLANFLDILHVVAPLIVVASGTALVVISGKLD